MKPVVARVSAGIAVRFFGHCRTFFWLKMSDSRTFFWYYSTLFILFVNTCYISRSIFNQGRGMSGKKELVVKSNRLVEASYRLTLVEQQIILFSICRSREEQRGLSPDTPVTITAKDFAEKFGTNSAMVYAQLKEAMNTLFERYVVLHDIHPESGKPRVTKTRWISTASYIDGEGAIQIIFAPKIIPYITRLETEFTAYRLEKIGNLSSVHAVRMYELLMQYLNIGSRELKISQLKERLGLESEYSDIINFKRRVIDISVAQINAHTDITTSYTQRKTGRNVTHLNFKIDAKEIVPKPVKKPSLTRAYVGKNARPGETYETAMARLRAERARA
jgi:plasmid replication initiation protein